MNNTLFTWTQATEGTKGIFMPVHKVFSVQFFNYYIYGTIHNIFTNKCSTRTLILNRYINAGPLLQILIMPMWDKNAKNSLKINISCQQPLVLLSPFPTILWHHNVSTYVFAAIDLKDKSVNKMLKKGFI